MTLAHQAPARQDTPAGPGVVTAPDPRAAERALWRHRAAVRRKRLALGQPTSDLVDATPAREHINHLRTQGMGWQRVAARAGVAVATVSRLLHGLNGYPPTLRIPPDTAARLLAVQLDTHMVSAVGTHRRVQALVACGWSMRVLSRRLGHSPTYLAKMLRHDGPVTAATARKVRGLYDQLWDQQPPQGTPGDWQGFTAARRLAQRRRWPPPQAWDDATIDDPAAKPAGNARPAVDVDELAVADLVAGRITADSTGPAEREAAVAQLTKRGLSAAEIAVRIGMHQRSVVRLRGKAS